MNEKLKIVAKTAGIILNEMDRGITRYLLKSDYEEFMRNSGPRGRNPNGDPLSFAQYYRFAQRNPEAFASLAFDDPGMSFDIDKKDDRAYFRISNALKSPTLRRLHRRFPNILRRNIRQRVIDHEIEHFGSSKFLTT